MRFSIKQLGAAAIGLLALASCAKETSESYNEIERRSLDAWMKLHRPELLGNRQEARGFSYYVDVLEAGSTDKADTLIAETDCWVQYEFTARDLNGNVCMTRNAVEAKQQGTFTRYTYYTPYFRYSGSDYTTLLEGSYYALREPLTLSAEYIAAHPDRGLKNGMQARRGTELMLYLPSSLAYSSSGASSDAGYGGQYSLDANRPAILHIKVMGRVSNPLAYEGEAVDAFVESNGTVCPVEKEEDSEKLASVRRSLRDAEEPELPDTNADPFKYTWYQAVDTVPQLYISHVYSPGREPAVTYNWKDTYSVPYFPYNESMAALDRKINDALVERFGAGTYKGDSIRSGETVNVWYIGRFLDGFIFDTNIDEVKKLIYGEVQSEGSAYQYEVPEEGDTSTLETIYAWYYSLPQLRYGQWAAIVTTSSYAYGAAGKSGGSSTSGGSSSNSYLDYYNYMNYYNYYNNYYGGMYGNSYYDSYYNGYYGGLYNNYYYNNYYYDDYSSSSGSTTTTYSTEIPAYSPLLFEIYIEPKEE